MHEGRVRPSQERRFRAERRPAHHHSVALAGQRHNAIEKQFKRYLPWPGILVVAAEPAHRFRHGALGRKEPGPIRVHTPTGPRKGQNPHPRRVIGPILDAVRSRKPDFAHREILAFDRRMVGRVPRRSHDSSARGTHVSIGPGEAPPIG